MSPALRSFTKVKIVRIAVGIGWWAITSIASGQVVLSDVSSLQHRRWFETVFIPGYARPSRPLIFSGGPWQGSFDTWSRYLRRYLPVGLSDDFTSDSLLTQLAYYQGPQELQYFAARHQQIRSHIAATFAYQRLATSSFLISRQTRLRLMEASVVYRTGKHQGGSKIQWGDATWQENGGLNNPTNAKGILPLQYPALLTRLQGVTQNLQQVTAKGWGQWPIRSTHSNASSWVIRHRWKIQHSTYRYSDALLRQHTNYYPILHDTDLGGDSLKDTYTEIEGTIEYNTSKWQLRAITKARLLWGTIDSTHISLHEFPILLQTGWQLAPWHLTATLEWTHAPNGQLTFKYVDSSWHLEGAITRDHAEPFWWLTIPQGNYERPQQWQDPIFYYQVHMRSQWKQWHLEIVAWQWDHYPYWDTLLYLLDTMKTRTFQWKLQRKWQYGRWSGRIMGVWQRGNGEWWSYPSVVIMSEVAVQWQWLHRMHSTLYVRGLYHTPYTAARFFPNRLRWMNPSGQYINNYPWIEVGMRERVDHFEGFIRAENVLFWAFQHPFWISPRYPAAPFRITWGLQWQFLD